MTEPPLEDQHLVRVRAQVMTRDDSSGGWVPLGGGGLSNVSVRKRTPDKNEYLIYGKRISDQSAVLSCTIKKDFEYNRVMPTFHHWKTGEKKFGLTFQTAADARAFDKGVRMVIDDLLDGNGTEFSPLRKYTDVGDDDVFMTLDLPVERDSTSSGSVDSESHNQIHQYPPSHLHRMYFASRTPNFPNKDKDSSASGFKDKDKMSDLMCCERDLQLLKDDEQYSSYVQFSRQERPERHEYSYPTIQPDSSSNLSKFNDIRLSSCTTNQPKNMKKTVQLDPLSLQPPPLLPSRGSSKKRRSCGKKRQCIHCHEIYNEDQNSKGKCRGAGPDIVQTTIEACSCMCIARGCMYHFFTDPEEEEDPEQISSNPCSCHIESTGKCVRRYISLTLLSILVPCLCLYLPLMCIHQLGKSCKLCGKQHSAVQ